MTFFVCLFLFHLGRNIILLRLLAHIYLRLLNSFPNTAWVRSKHLWNQGRNRSYQKPHTDGQYLYHQWRYYSFLLHPSTSTYSEFVWHLDSFTPREILWESLWSSLPFWISYWGQNSSRDQQPLHNYFWKWKGKFPGRPTKGLVG